MMLSKMAQIISTWLQQLLSITRYIFNHRYTFFTDIHSSLTYQTVDM